MKIHGMCLVKNEADIITETLGKAAQWCDFVYVFDTGSTDETWERVKELARRQPSVIPLRYETRAFSDSLRAEIFSAFRKQAAPSDWWCRLDADEVYIDDPKVFLRAVPHRHHVVFSASCQFYLTEKELESRERDPETWEALPVEERLRHYVYDHSEARFFRLRAGLKWKCGSWPLHVGITHPRRIRLKHLQYRSPSQIQKRLDTRRQASAEGWKLFDAYDGVVNWQEKVADSSKLQFDDQSGRYVVEESRLPRHMEKPLHRAVKYFMHGSGLWA
jgi:glycosyltransferase involved in cell wall biosynthesis